MHLCIINIICAHQSIITLMLVLSDSTRLTIMVDFKGARNYVLWLPCFILSGKTKIDTVLYTMDKTCFS